MQALQAHLGFWEYEDDDDDDNDEEGVKQIWQLGFWDGGLRKVQEEQAQDMIARGEEREREIDEGFC